MPLWEAFRLAIEQLRVQKLKSVLTLIGVMMGVMFLIAVVSVVEGMGKYLEQELIGKLMAVNSFDLRSRPAVQVGEIDQERMNALLRRPPIIDRDSTIVRDALPAGFRYTVTTTDQVTITSRYARPRSVQMIAVTAPYFDITNMGVTAGRVFSEQEGAMKSPVVVIGQDVRDRLFPGVDPIGRELQIGRIPYQVIGVAEPKGNVFGMSLDQFIVIPYGSAARRLTGREPGVVDAIKVQAPSELAVPLGEDAVRQAMRSHRKLRPAQEDNFTFEKPDDALEFFNKIKSYVVIAGIVLPVIGLIVGAIVIMNIMLVAVAERTREIGIRKSLGARKQDIMQQFLIEATTLSTAGAALGILFGAFLAWLVAAASPLPTSVAPWSVVVSVLLGAGVGIGAGVYPASRAAALDPITALRAE